MELLLASASPSRKRLLEQACIPHRVQVSGIDEEAIQHADPLQLVQDLAIAKAKAVAHAISIEGISAGLGILACDSMFEFDGEVFGKPKDPADAISRWQRMAGGWGVLHTGHCWLAADGAEYGEIVSTRLQFAAVGEAEIKAYVATGEPLNCAGCFALEGRGGLMIERIDGCFSNVIGLSLPLLRRWLKRS
ncbi:MULTISPECIES: nucleoside triphosphate pyrophosphatase [Synechococcus]|jgi:septum formation protein|uniref:Maf family protein n=1 Tax=Synechococcus TaxID=1129 RepID=UPI000E92F76A|nr:nucleoside triphosphate pyrophosphatase [Synechococcus lacustris]MCP9922269.1 septum formation inhibitor Maf [Synechococcus lacustris Cruz CV12-2]HBU25794.1 septum formation inhibitor Maf [Synechococcales bacterium UBA8138]